MTAQYHQTRASAKPTQHQCFRISEDHPDGGGLLSARSSLSNCFHLSCGADDRLSRCVDAPEGATTQVWSATKPALEGIGGVYCENVEVARIVPPHERANFIPDDSTHKLGVMPHAIDPDAARHLWAANETLLALRK